MKTKDKFQYGLGVVIVLAVMALLLVVFLKPLPVANHDIALLVIGALVAKFGDVVAYFYNSSKGSADKTDIIANQNQNKPVG
jgi:hypothetical protein